MAMKLLIKDTNSLFDDTFIDGAMKFKYLLIY